MSLGKSQPARHPKLAGMDELDIVTNETDVPVPYFAGLRRLDVSWIMQAVIDHTTTVDSGGKGKSAKSGGNAKNYYGHCAGVICQGQLDFFAGLLINNELVFPNAFIWDSKIFKTNRTVIYDTGSTPYNAWRTSAETDQAPPTFPWTLYATGWSAGSYANGALVVANGTMIFKSAHAANTAVPPVTATSSADWIYVSSPDLWSTLSGGHFWDVGSIVAWEGQVYQTATATSNEPPNAPWTLYRQLESASANPYLMPVAKSTRFGTNSGPGDWYLYWGLANQVLDTVGEAILSALGHPPYRNNAVIMGKNILFGTQTVQPPSVQVLAGRAPVQSLIVGASAQLDSRWTANPWCVLAELLTHPIIGLGLPPTWFDATSWQAEADRCAANPQFFYISPLYTSLKKIGELATELLGYPDAFIFWSTVATLMAGHWPHGEAAPAFNGANTINRNSIRKEFSTQSEGWWGTMNSIAVSISDIQAGFKSRPCLASNLFNMSVTKRLLSQKIDRPFITDYNQGLAWAHEFAKISGDQMSSGTIELQSEKATGVKPGSLFLLTDDALGTSEIQRCTKRIISKPGTGDGGITKIYHETERGIAPQPYQPTANNPTQAAGPSPALVTNYAVAQLPSQLAGEANTIALLAGRENSYTSSLQVWFRQADGVAFQELGSNTAFAVAGWFDTGINSSITYGANNNETTVQVGAVTQGNTYNVGDTGFWKYIVSYSSSSSYTGLTTAIEGTDYTIDPSTGNLTILTGGGIATGQYVEVQFWNTVALAYDPNTPAADVDSISVALTQDEINDNDLVLFAFQASNPAVFEIMSVRSVQAVGTDSSGGALNGDPVLFLKVVRAQYGTLPGGDGVYVWGTNPSDQIFVIPRASITAFSNLAFPGLAASNSSATFILAPESAWVTAQISDIYDVANNPTGLSTEFVYAFEDIYGPDITWIQQQYAVSGGTFGTISSFSGTFVDTDTFLFTFQIDTSTGANIVAATLTGIVGNQQVTLWAQTFNSAQSQIVTVQFQLPSAGTWNLSVNARCDDGTQTNQPLTLVGSTTPVTMQMTGPVAPSPVISSYTVSGSTIEHLKFGPLPSGLTVYYQVQNYGVAYNPSGWTAATYLGSGIYGTVPNFTDSPTNKFLYAYCHQSGVSDSPVALWSFPVEKRV